MSRSQALALVPPRAPALPTLVTDALLDCALGHDADQLWIEPATDGSYQVSVEREGTLVASAKLGADLATAVIARLAYVANVDLVSARAATGATRLRGHDRERDFVFTLRPGAEVRGEATFLTRRPRATLTASEPVAGQTIGSFRVIGRLGEGGMGCVYQVEHTTLGRPFALKVLHRRVIDRDANSIERFLREARAASRIRHPHIIDVFDFGYLSDGRPYFVMELLDGKSLLRTIDHTGLEVGRALAFARQLAAALARAHECGVIHADVSAANIIVEDGAEPSIKLVDFGLAELREPTANVAMAEVCFGTPCYIAPEVIRGNPAGERSDQYSFGILLWEMLTGEPPFAASSVRALCLKHLNDPLPVPVSPHGELPEELVAVLERCLAKAPAARYPTMRAVLVELDRIAAHHGRRDWRRWLAS
jgi:serine/threonine protein kinase